MPNKIVFFFIKIKCFKLYSRKNIFYKEFMSIYLLFICKVNLNNIFIRNYSNHMYSNHIFINFFLKKKLNIEINNY